MHACRSTLEDPTAALQGSGLRPGDSIAIAGCGPTGLAATMLARTMGAGRIFAIDHHAYRLDAAARLGATPLNFDTGLGEALSDATDDRGVDVAIEAAGKADGLTLAASLPRRSGSIVSLGSNLGAAQLQAGLLTGQQTRLIAAGQPAVRNYMAPVAKLLTQGVIDPAPLVSHMLQLAEAPRAFDLASRRAEGALKILIRP